MTFLLHYDVTWYIVEGNLNEHNDGNLIKKHETFLVKWVVSIKPQMTTAMNFIDEHVLQKFVWNNNLYVPQFSREQGPHSSPFRFEHQQLLGAWGEMTQDGGLKIRRAFKAWINNYSHGVYSGCSCLLDAGVRDKHRWSEIDLSRTYGCRRKAPGVWDRFTPA